jgi:nucleoside-diphosphate-sugar epimerase
VAELDVVTGAFSFTGSHVAEALLGRGRRVRTLTRTLPDPSHPLASRVERAPLAFDVSLRKSLEGADTLYNTYWARFERGETTFERVVSNSTTLFRAAAEAGVRRVVHISVANAGTASRFPYFRAKAQVEEALRASGLSHAVVRPTIVFGPDDIFFNNLAWGLRHAPLFLVPGDGRYEAQPVSVWDVARLCVDAGSREGDEAFDASGPDRWPFLDLVRLIKRHVGGRALVRTAPKGLARAVGRFAGFVLRDVLATPDELDVAEEGLLVSHEPPRGRDRFEDWLERSGRTLGRKYASELGRNYRGQPAP